MRRTCAALLVLPGACENGSSPATAAAATAKYAGGNAWFEHTTADLGELPAGRAASATFAFRNPHQETCALTRVIASCACTEIRLRLDGAEYRIDDDGFHAVGEDTPRSHVLVRPGARGTIEARMQLAAGDDRKAATIDVTTGDPSMPHARLRLGARAATPVLVEPPEVVIADVFPGDRRTFRVRVRGRAHALRRVRVAHAPAVARDCTAQRCSDDRRTWIVSGALVARLGDSGGDLELRADGVEIRVPVVIDVRPPIRVTPGEVVTLGLVRRDAPRTVDLGIVDNRAGGHAPITGWEWLDGNDAARASIGVEIGAAAGGARVTITPPAPAPEGGRPSVLRAALRLRVAHAEATTVDVRLVGLLQ